MVNIFDNILDSTRKKKEETTNTVKQIKKAGQNIKEVESQLDKTPSTSTKANDSLVNKINSLFDNSKLNGNISLNSNNIGNTNIGTTKETVSSFTNDVLQDAVSRGQKTTNAISTITNLIGLSNKAQKNLGIETPVASLSEKTTPLVEKTFELGGNVVKGAEKLTDKALKLDEKFDEQTNIDSVKEKIKKDNTYYGKLINEKGDYVDYSRIKDRLEERLEQASTDLEKKSVQYQLDEVNEIIKDQDRLNKYSQYQYLKSNGASEDDIAEFKRFIVNGDGDNKALKVVAGTVGEFAGSLANMAESQYAMVSNLLGTDYDFNDPNSLGNVLINDSSNILNAVRSGDLTKTEQVIMDVYQGTAPFLYSIVLAAATKGVSATDIFTNAAKRQVVFDNALLYSDMSVFGQTIKQRMYEGYDFNTSYLNATAHACLSDITEQIGGEALINIIANPMTNKIGQNLITSYALYMSKTLLNSFGPEFVEEGMEAAATPLIDAITLNKDITLKQYIDKVWTEDTLHEMIIGGIGGLVMGIPSSIATNVIYNKHDYEQHKAYRDTLSSMLNSGSYNSYENIILQQNINNENAILQAYVEVNPTVNAFGVVEDANSKIIEITQEDIDKAKLDISRIDIDNQISPIAELNEQMLNTESKLYEELSSQLATEGINIKAADYAKLSSEARLNTSITSKYSKEINRDVIFADLFDKDGKVIDGVFINGKMVVNPNANQGALSTFIHELTHGIESSKYYKKLKKLTKQIYGENYNSAVNSIVDKYSSVTALSFDNAERELVAKTTQQLMDNPMYVQRLVTYDKSLANKMYEELKHIGTFTDSVSNLEYYFMKAYNDIDPKQISIIDTNNTQLSVSTMAQATGMDVVIGDEHHIGLTYNGEVVDNVTSEMIENSPLGALLKQTKENGVISQEDYNKQIEFFADSLNLFKNTNDPQMYWALSGSLAFTPSMDLNGVKNKQLREDKATKSRAYTKNADPQYVRTFDVTTICNKTQQLINVMSATMMKLDRGLTADEIVKVVYDEVYKAGEPVPCPVCYVFSRWVGTGGVLQRIKNCQDTYTNMSNEDIQKRIKALDKQVAAIAQENGYETNTKAIKELSKALHKELDDINYDIQKGKKISKAEEKRRTRLEQDTGILDERAWITDVRLSENYKPVPSNVLFDLNKGEQFAQQYPETWKWRTTRGSGLGKAITPYSSEVLGQTIIGIASSKRFDYLGNYRNAKTNEFLSGNTLSSDAQTTLNKAVINARRQNLIGGSRLQSTSDFRFEFFTDYLIHLMELQSVGSNAQMYTKVPESVTMLASAGIDVNCSLMPKGKGWHEVAEGTDGAIELAGHYYVLDYSNVTGMNPEDAFKLSGANDSVQPIMVGINDTHMLLCLNSVPRTVEELRAGGITQIIPYHASGGSFPRYASMMKTVNETVDKADRTDYAKFEHDSNNKNATKEQKAARQLRLDIIMGKLLDKQGNLITTNAQKKIMSNNQYLNDLYERFYTEGVDDTTYHNFQAKAQASVIFPYEYWDKTSTIENADINGDRFVEYCQSLGMTPRFEQFSREHGYWTTLIDRSMYDLNGNYREQQAVNISGMKTDYLFRENMVEGIVQPSNQFDPNKTSDITKNVTNKLSKNKAKYSISEEIDSEGNSLTFDQVDYFNNDGGILDKEGNLENLYHTTTVKFDEAMPWKNPYYRFKNNFVMYYSNNKDVSSSYVKGKVFEITKDNYNNVDTASYLYDVIMKNKNKIVEYFESQIIKNDGIFSYLLNEIDDLYEYATNSDDEIDISSIRESVENLQFRLNEVYSNIGQLNKYSGIANSSEDSMYTQSEKENIDMLVYNIAGDIEIAKDEIRNIKETKLPYKKYKNFIKEINNNYLINIIESIDAEYRAGYQYAGYGKAKNPYIIDGKSYTDPYGNSYVNWNNINDSKTFVNSRREFLDLFGAEELINMEIDNKESFYSKASKLLNKAEEISSRSRTDDIFHFLTNNPSILAYATNLNYNNNFTNVTTNDVCKAAWAINYHLKQMKFDAIIFDGIYDSGSSSSNANVPSKIVALFSPQQFKSIDNLHPTDDKRWAYSISEETETSYNNAINRNDLETASYIVDKVATDQGYELDYHGTTAEPFNIFNSKKPIWVTQNRNYARVYSDTELYGGNDENARVMELYVKHDNPIDITKLDTYAEVIDWETNEPSKELKALAKASNMDADMLLGVAMFNSLDTVYQVVNSERFADGLREQGYDSIKAIEYGNITYGILDNKNIKLADPITYDDQGNVTPLSERFNSTNNDIRYSISDDNNNYLFDDEIRNNLKGTLSDEEIEDVVNNYKKALDNLSVNDALGSAKQVQDQLNKIKSTQYVDDLIKQNGISSLTDAQLNKLESNILNNVGKKAKEETTTKVLDDVDEGRKLSPIKESVDKLKQKFVDRGQAIWDLDRKKKLDGDLYAFYNQYRNAESMADRQIYKDKGLANIINSIPKEQQVDFSTMMYHWLNTDAAKIGKSVFNGVSAEESEGIVSKYLMDHPDWQEKANQIWKYEKELRDLLVQYGRISQDTANKWEEMYPHYVHIERIITPETSKTIETEDAKVKSSNKGTVEERKGGSSNLRSLNDALTIQTKKVFKAITMNEFVQEYVKAENAKYTLWQDYQDTSIDKIDESIGNEVQGPDENTPATFIYYVNGDTRTVEVPSDIYNAFVVDRVVDNKITDTLSKANNIRRNLLTSQNITFLPRNIARDTQDILLKSRHPFLTYSTIPSAIVDIATNSDTYQEYREFGGGRNNATQIHNGTDLYNKTIGLIERANDFAETLPRYAEYKASREQGRSVTQSMYDSDRVTTNFKMGGDWTKFADRNGFTFLNASVESLTELARDYESVYDKKGWKGVLGKMAISTLVFNLPLMIINHLRWKDDDDYQNLSDYVKDNYYILWKNKDGSFTRINKGRVAAAYQSVLNTIYENGVELVSDDTLTEKAKNMWENTLDGISGVWDNVGVNNPFKNNILSPIADVINNKTWYGDDLLSEYELKKDTSEQYDYTTDLLSKWIGQNTNTSPIKLNYLLTQYSGGLGDVILPMLTPKAETYLDDGTIGGKISSAILSPVINDFTVDPVFKNQNVSDLFELDTELSQRASKTSASDDEKIASKYITSIKYKMYDLYGERSKIYNDSSLTDADKYREARKIQQQIDELAKYGLETYDNVDMERNYAQVGDTAYYNKNGTWTKFDSDELDEINSLGMTTSQKADYVDIKQTIKGKDSSKEIGYNSIQNSSLNAEQKNYLYDKYYSTKITDNINDLDISDEEKIALKYKVSTAESDKDSNGETIKNSKAQKVASYYEEAGVLDNIFANISQYNEDPSNYGLTKSVYSDYYGTSASSSSSSKQLKAIKAYVNALQSSNIFDNLSNMTTVQEAKKKAQEILEKSYKG